MMNSIQQQVADFVEEHALQTSIQSRVLDLMSEVGELAKEVLKGSDYGNTAFQITPEWSMELADALFALVCLANGTGVDLEDALRHAISKYQKRLEDKGDMGSGG